MLKEVPDQNFSEQAITEAVELQTSIYVKLEISTVIGGKYYEISVKKTRPQFNPLTASFHHKQL